MTQIITAIDVSDRDDLLRLLRTLDPVYTKIKIGKEAFTAMGPRAVEIAMHLGYKVFLDLKYHDIPTTTLKSVRAACEMGIWGLTIHACGGPDMIGAALKGAIRHDTKVIAVTSLTSEQDRSRVVQLAHTAYDLGADGVVCHPFDVAIIRHHISSVQANGPVAGDFEFVCPGIRRPSDPPDDQNQPHRGGARDHQRTVPT